MSEELTAGDMESLVAQYHQSDQTRKAFAAAHGISIYKLIYWIGKVYKSGKSPKAEDTTTRGTGSDFVPLKVEVSSLVGSNCVLIRLASGVEIQIPM